MEVNKEDINREVYFIGKCNEMNNLNTELSIDNNIQNEFKNYFVPKKEGNFSIK